MHRLVIHKLGPIDHCELECSEFMTFTGFQASGKSTIAKAIYYFRTIKEDIVELAKGQALRTAAISGAEVKLVPEYNSGLKKDLENSLREKFLRTFGSSWGMANEMYMEYHFTESCFVRISLRDDITYATPNYIWITCSRELRDFLYRKNGSLSVTALGVSEEKLKKFKEELFELFDDHCSIVYIPAGRSMITLLSQQLGYIYATMDDMQKRSLDSCTKDYLERILRLKPEFSEGLQGMASYPARRGALPPKIVRQALDLIKKVLRGTYRYRDGEEQIVLDDGRYVKINFSSSGQQECVWILNLLFYYLLQSQKTLFIIEEPESHLFPESQKYITELIALAANCGHSILLTTHSPYVLGTLNNLLYAHAIPKEYTEAAGEVIPANLWLDDAFFDSWFVKNGTIENCMDQEIHMIQNERIDEISKVINEEFEELLNLQDTEGAG
ncbi:MAG: AAA family ATPase [Eubacteriales bacterium]|nr:AAA family ATPase [Eubacteriales bacterium]